MFIFAVLSSLASLFALFPALRQKRLCSPQNHLRYSEKRKKPLLHSISRRRSQSPISNAEIENVSSAGLAGITHLALA